MAGGLSHQRFSNQLSKWPKGIALIRNKSTLFNATPRSCHSNRYPAAETELSASMKASKSALMISACVVGIP